MLMLILPVSCIFGSHGNCCACHCRDSSALWLLVLAVGCPTTSRGWSGPVQLLISNPRASTDIVHHGIAEA